MPKKACLIYVSSMKAEADYLRTELNLQGYDVCLTEVQMEAAVAAQNGIGFVTPEIEGCLTGADVKVFLIPTADTPASLLLAAGRAAKMPGKLVAVCADDATLPQLFDDVANSVVPIKSQNLIKAITTTELHESLDGTEKPPRIPARVKCQ